VYVGSVSPGSRSNPYGTPTPGIMPSHPLTQPYRTCLVPLTDYSQADAGGAGNLRGLAPRQGVMAPGRVANKRSEEESMSTDDPDDITPARVGGTWTCAAEPSPVRLRWFGVKAEPHPVPRGLRLGSEVTVPLKGSRGTP
jgi:hypothetical protein